MIKLSDYVFKFIEEKGIKHAFMLPGGGAMHLIDSIGKSKIEYICCGHEQAVAIAAESYGQHTNDIGVALVTSGPGATNAITGVTAGWIDSTPMFIISGQAKRSDLIGSSGVRQMGSQEVHVIDMVKSITKYAVQILDPKEIKYHLEKAYYEATTGRMGPVWLDIPLDVQAAMINEEKLIGYKEQNGYKCNFNIETEVKEVVELFKYSRKPLILAGNGIKLSNAEQEFYKFIDKLQVPVQTTWKTVDLIEENHPLYAGHPGIMGDRGANFVLQSCDLLIILGSRLDTSITAFNHANFGINAKKIMVDIDEHEIDKMKIDIKVKVVSNVKDFILKLNSKTDEIVKSKILNKIDENNKWLIYCKNIREKYPVVTEKHVKQKKCVSAYYFIDELCNRLTSQDIIVPESSGGAGEITYQAFKVKKGQKIKNAAGLGSMGFGLPYAIGSCLSNGRKRTILINGDGAFQLNIQELETVKRLNLPIKIFIWNNNGYASIRAMQRNIFEGHYVASEEGSGLTIPNLRKVAEAYEIQTFMARDNEEMVKILPQVLESDGPVLCELMILPEETVSPRVKSVKLENGSMISKPLEDMWPFLSENEINESIFI
ncbi:thiamine pyrophosphate-binding protein [Clostridium sporogenes]|uniref:Acetolactate synthase large subunit n=1 Tax=Clostridium sporogenes TaxID=1509 RepID=A0A7U4JQP2_CLOSG|nr:thiamine pyrophosphate-binding protein [Clostridium sporogenes]AVP60137.1 thiamine pyrophosphate-binding protein [Clostridium botulinum]AKC63518.1 acetolactate synthase large subunit [Clostridium sporogenes]AKJ90685.1 thiamine pyrophosphate-binding protein [Clostridium sporogenes]KCZ67216.1 acetolactate synthase large subunit [Clostridium sporogenes]KRU37941.1 acetolactate synthase large subunit [Clostridium sporogenes]